MAISAIKINIEKIFFCRKIYHDVVVHVPNFQLPAKSSSFFCAFFLHFYGLLYCGHPILADGKGLKSNTTVGPIFI